MDENGSKCLQLTEQTEQGLVVRVHPEKEAELHRSVSQKAHVLRDN